MTKVRVAPAWCIAIAFASGCGGAAIDLARTKSPVVKPNSEAYRKAEAQRVALEKKNANAEAKRFGSRGIDRALPN